MESPPPAALHARSPPGLFPENVAPRTGEKVSITSATVDQTRTDYKP